MMKRKETDPKPKEPVKLRFRELKGGNKSIFLECYTGSMVRNGSRVGGKHTYEFLKLYLIPENSKEDKLRNKETLALAKTIQSQRIVELQNSAYGFGSKTKSRTSIFDYVNTHYLGAKRLQSDNYQKVIRNVMGKLRKFRGDKIKLVDIDTRFLDDFLNFLIHSQRYGSPQKSGNNCLSTNTINCYFAILRNILDRASRDGYLQDNPMKNYTLSDRIKVKHNERPYLTLDEIQTLIDTPCPYPTLKDAFLFSCMCGLRISDIRHLKWENISINGDRAVLTIRVQKTKDILTLPLSKEALRWLPAREGSNSSELVFPLKSDMSINVNLLKWTVLSGIKKHLTFHIARHTHATMMLTLGADIYTVSKLLGHKSINTTQIYAKIVDKKKEEAKNLTPKFM